MGHSAATAHRFEGQLKRTAIEFLTNWTMSSPSVSASNELMGCRCALAHPTLLPSVATQA